MGFLILFQNEHFLAVDKPAGVLTIPGREGVNGTRPCLSTEVARDYGRVWPVHRLDFEVSGIVLFARSAEAHRAANLWFEQRHIHKTYEAWSTGTPPKALEAEWHSKLLRGKKRAYECDQGKSSVTRATYLGEQSFRGEKVLRWRLEPLTGRSHQLRYELAKHGFPILGDVLYGSSNEVAPDTIALRAIKLDFSGCADAKDYALPAAIEVAGLDGVLK